MRATLFLTIPLAALAATVSASSTGPELEAVLEQARAAAKRDAWSRLEHGLALSGEARIQGVDGGFELHFGPDGAYRFENDGPLASTSGWDGKIAWARLGGGPAQTLALEERDTSLLGQWVHSGFWVDSTLAIRLVEDDAEAVVLGLAFTDSPTEAKLTLDRETWLPAALVWDSGEHDVTLTFSEYREVAGVPIAHDVHRSMARTEGGVKVRAGRPASPDPGTRYAFVRGGTTDTRFDDEGPVEIEIQRVRTGHLMVHPRVDGEDLGWFILDTGAGKLCIDPEAADRLELSEFGEVPAMGIGGTIMASFRQGASFALGPVEIADPVFVEIELSFLEQPFGMEVAGICGYDLFARAIVELDLEGPSAALFDPAKYALEGGAWSELILEDRLPTVRCSFEGDRSGFFKIDTGATGAVSFHAPAVEALGLLEGRETRAGAVGGVGGMTPVGFGQLDWFELGGRRFEAVAASFAKGEGGVHGDTDVLGTIGGELLQPFRVVLDYPGQRIALLPRGE